VWLCSVVVVNQDFLVVVVNDTEHVPHAAACIPRFANASSSTPQG